MNIIHIHEDMNIKIFNDTWKKKKKNRVCYRFLQFSFSNDIILWQVTLLALVLYSWSKKVWWTICQTKLFQCVVIETEERASKNVCLDVVRTEWSRCSLRSRTSRGQSGDIMVVGWTLFGEVLLCHLQSKNETINQELLSMPSKP